MRYHIKLRLTTEALTFLPAAQQGVGLDTTHRTPRTLSQLAADIRHPTKVLTTPWGYDFEESYDPITSRLLASIELPTSIFGTFAAPDDSTPFVYSELRQILHQYRQGATEPGTDAETHASERLVPDVPEVPPTPEQLVHLLQQLDKDPSVRFIA